MAGSRSRLLWGELRGLLTCVWEVRMCLHIYSHPAKQEFPALQRCSGRVSSPFTPFSGHGRVPALTRGAGAVPEHVRELPASPTAELQIPMSRIASGSPEGRVPWGQPTPTGAQGACGGRGDPAGGAAGLLEAAS